MIAKQLVKSTVESIFAARDIQSATGIAGWDSVGNLGTNQVNGVPTGIFANGFNPVRNDVYLNYTGSLIYPYSSRNNGSFKTNSVLGAPKRNWTFDTSFLDPTRLPPGTPFIQSTQLTGYERVNQ